MKTLLSTSLVGLFLFMTSCGINDFDPLVGEISLGDIEASSLNDIDPVTTPNDNVSDPITKGADTDSGDDTSDTSSDTSTDSSEPTDDEPKVVISDKTLPIDIDEMDKADIPNYDFDDEDKISGKLNPSLDPTDLDLGGPLTSKTEELPVVRPTDENNLTGIEFTIHTLDALGSGINNSNLASLVLHFAFTKNGNSYESSCTFEELGFYNTSKFGLDTIDVTAAAKSFKINGDPSKSDSTFTVALDLKNTVCDTANYKTSDLENLSLSEIDLLGLGVSRTVTKLGIKEVKIAAIYEDNSKVTFYNNPHAEVYLSGSSSDDIYPNYTEECAGSAANGGFARDLTGDFNPSSSNDISEAPNSESIYFTRNDQVISTKITTQSEVGSGTKNKLRIAFQDKGACGDDRLIVLDRQPNSRDTTYNYHFYNPSVFGHNSTRPQTKAVYLSINDESFKKDLFKIKKAEISFYNAWSDSGKISLYKGSAEDFELDGRDRSYVSKTITLELE